MTDTDKLSALRSYADSIVEMLDDPYGLLQGDVDALLEVFDALVEAGLLAVEQ